MALIATATTTTTTTKPKMEIKKRNKWINKLWLCKSIEIGERWMPHHSRCASCLCVPVCAWMCMDFIHFECKFINIYQLIKDNNLYFCKWIVWLGQYSDKIWLDHVVYDDSSSQSLNTWVCNGVNVVTVDLLFSLSLPHDCYHLGFWRINGYFQLFSLIDLAQ